MFAQAGSLDQSFGSGGKVITSFGKHLVLTGTEPMCLQQDGKILEAGNRTKPFIIRYFSNGAIDSSFGKSGTAISSINQIQSINVQPDDKIILAGNFTFLDSNNVFTKYFDIERYLINGSIDSTFGTNGKSTCERLREKAISSLQQFNLMAKL